MAFWRWDASDSCVCTLAGANPEDSLFPGFRYEHWATPLFLATNASPELCFRMPRNALLFICPEMHFLAICTNALLFILKFDEHTSIALKLGKRGGSHRARRQLLTGRC
jgi:hypothetical protein